MLQRFASALTVASAVVAVGALALRLNPAPTLESRYLLTSIWCMAPVVWGLWAMMIPKSWLPQRLPLWGAILGLIAGPLGVFVWNVTSRMSGETLSTPYEAWRFL